MRGRGLMLVAGMRAGERRAERIRRNSSKRRHKHRLTSRNGSSLDRYPSNPSRDVTAELQKPAELHNSGVLKIKFAAAKQNYYLNPTFFSAKLTTNYFHSLIS
jgi:hypothetical protein